MKETLCRIAIVQQLIQFLEYFSVHKGTPGTSFIDVMSDKAGVILNRRRRWCVVEVGPGEATRVDDRSGIRGEKRKL